MEEVTKAILSILVKGIFLRASIWTMKFQIQTFWRTFLSALITVGSFCIVAITVLQISGVHLDPADSQVVDWLAVSLGCLLLVAALVLEGYAVKTLFKVTVTQATLAVALEHLMIVALILVVSILIGTVTWVYRLINALLN